MSNTRVLIRKNICDKSIFVVDSINYNVVYYGLFCVEFKTV